jgi:hypothetical protein
VFRSCLLFGSQFRHVIRELSEISL